MIRGLFGSKFLRKERARVTSGMDLATETGLAAMNAALVVVDADYNVLSCWDGLQMFPTGPLAPQTVGDLAASLGGAKDVQGAISIALRDVDKPNASSRRGSDKSSAKELDRSLFALRANSQHPNTDRWITVTSRRVPVRPDTNRRSQIVLIFTEVTEQRHYQHATRRRIDMMTRVLERAPFGLVVVEQGGQLADANAAFRNLVVDDFEIGCYFSDFFHPDCIEPLTSLLEVVTSTHDTLSASAPLELRLKGDSNRIVTIQANRTVISDVDQPGVLIYVIDVSERKRLETQFAQSQKMQAVGQLAGGIAHDFNNVLTAIIGFCDLLLYRHQPGDPSFADVMQIQQNANRAAGLTRQLLAFSRQQAIESHLVDVTDTLADLSNLLRRLLGEGVEMSMIHGRDLWRVRGDRGQLEQVVINLAVNARDAMNRSGRIIIQTSNYTADQPYELREDVMPAGEYVSIAVSDTGCGMTEDVLVRIFEPFFTTKEVGEGTGLGLAMVYGSVRQMGGFIVVYSAGPGKGTSFSIYLPRTNETERDRAALTRSGEVESNESDDTGGERILLVEDEDAVRLFSARALRAKGYDVTEARTGEVALGMLDQSFDLLITDMVMPKVDGATLVREVRKKFPDMPVICISGYTRESVEKEMEGFPNVSFLPKPFSLKQLSGRVRLSLESVRHKM